MDKNPFHTKSFPIQRKLNISKLSQKERVFRDFTDNKFVLVGDLLEELRELRSLRIALKTEFGRQGRFNAAAKMCHADQSFMTPTHSSGKASKECKKQKKVDTGTPPEIFLNIYPSQRKAFSVRESNPILMSKCGQSGQSFHRNEQENKDELFSPKPESYVFLFEKQRQDNARLLHISYKIGPSRIPKPPVRNKIHFKHA